MTVTNELQEKKKKTHKKETSYGVWTHASLVILAQHTCWRHYLLLGEWQMAQTMFHNLENSAETVITLYHKNKGTRGILEKQIKFYQTDKSV